MPNFDELFDEVILKVKSAAETTGKFAGEMAELGKLKYKAKQISWEIERTYSKLGVIAYEARKTGGNFDSVIDAAVEELDALGAQLESVEEKIRAFRKTERVRPESAEKDAEEEDVVVDFVDIKPSDEE
jgi:vacuolar-type H+-ATPase subunit I/STV1